MNTFFQDLRQGLRLLRRNPGFTAVALLSLALGIGANTAIFSLVNAVLLRPLPFPDPEQLVVIWEDASFVGFPRNTPAPGNYWDWKTQNQTLQDMAAIESRSFNITGTGEPERVEAESVTANFFPLLGISPIKGRVFSKEEDTPEGPNVTVLSHGLWQRRFGGDEQIIGKDVLLNGSKYTVIGIMPRGFQFLEKEIELWVAIGFSPEEKANHNSHYLTVVGRLKNGVTVKQANADIKAVMSRMVQAYPEWKQLGAFVVSLRDEVSGDVRRPLIVLLSAVGFVLLIACANIANLLLSLAASRKKEIAVRTALGAGRARIVRQLITESVFLSTVGGLLGLVFAALSFGFLRQLIPVGLSMATELKLDTPVLLFTIVVSIITGVIFGAAPALQAANTDLTEALKANSGRTGFGGNRKLRSVMVVAEVALALVLLVGSGLLLQTFYRLRSQDMGFIPENTVKLRTVLPRAKYPDLNKRVQFYEQVLERVRDLHGVAYAGYTTTIPLEWKGGTSGFAVEGHPMVPGSINDANHRLITTGYMQAMGMSLRQGRFFQDTDRKESIPVGIVNEAMAQSFWPNEDPIGKRFKFGGDATPSPWITIVGVIRNVKNMGLEVPVKAEVYQPVRQASEDYDYYAPRDLVIRASADAIALVPQVRNIIRKVDPDQPVSNVSSLETTLGEEVLQRKLGMTLLSCFAGLALLLSSLGIYGILSYHVVQSTPEFGVRLALGAQPRSIFGLILKRGMSLAFLGVAIGLAGAFALTRMMTSLLFGISASDPLTYATVAGLLLAVALIACFIPGLRAMKVHPMTALRYE